MLKAKNRKNIKRYINLLLLVFIIFGILVFFLTLGKTDLLIFMLGVKSGFLI